MKPHERRASYTVKQLETCITFEYRMEGQWAELIRPQRWTDDKYGQLSALEAK